MDWLIQIFGHSSLKFIYRPYRFLWGSIKAIIYLALENKFLLQKACYLYHRIFQLTTGPSLQAFAYRIFWPTTVLQQPVLSDYSRPTSIWAYRPISSGSTWYGSMAVLYMTYILQPLTTAPRYHRPMLTAGPTPTSQACGTPVAHAPACPAINGRPTTVHQSLQP